MSGSRKDGRRLTSPNLPGCWNPTVPSPPASRGFRQKPVSSRRKHIHHWYKSLAGGSRCACEAWRCEFAEGLHPCEVASEQGREPCPTHRVSRSTSVSAIRASRTETEFFRSIHTASVRLDGCFLGAGAISHSLSGFARRTQRKSPASFGVGGFGKLGKASRTSCSLKETGLGSSTTPRTRFPPNIRTNLFSITQHPNTKACRELSAAGFPSY